MSITPFFHVYHKYVFIMSNINKIRLSGTTYSIQDLNATKTIELTQAEYDALSQKDPNVFYIITDAKGADLSNYYTKTEADDLLDAKQDTLVSGTNIKTINNQSILGEGNIDIQGGSGGSITIDPSLDSGSTNPVANSAITNAINNRATKGEAYGSMTFGSSSGKEYVRFQKVNGTRDSERFISKINGYTVWGTTNVNACKDWELVETSAITTSVTSSSTDAQVPSAKAVYDIVGNINTILESI